jgi:lysozyme family protein
MNLWDTDLQFQACLPFTLKEEGGYSDDPHDPGGATDRGITQAEYDGYRTRKKLPYQDVRKMTTVEMEEIYYDSYWLPWCPLVPPGLNLYLFDNNVNEGPDRGIRLLQETIGVTPDGIVGQETKSALEEISTEADEEEYMIRRYAQLREAFYKSLPTFRYFGKDWIGRSERIEQAALAMVKS